MAEAWEFFSTPRNLDRLTPKSVGFKITHCASETMHQGQIIAYKIKVAPMIWVSWLTEISQVENRVMFVDSQLSGPYKVWHHTHRFQENENGVMMTDDVAYVMPFGILGELVHALFVKRQLTHIFDERRRLVAEVFSAKSASAT
ncbi:SRPBCC family protein [Verrucomicrobiaceae bacterium 5K15]|uniref:SRPBCC family protein n=2 Tax=Oceaniferula flava TaxID=2800421 RepID=A0AAE2SE30_9BACT|nr:SRPBCC family protein [Oceaniferula flavus]MBM1135937.1 SRPBCC family protein [Oceaniferula flavus]